MLGRVKLFHDAGGWGFITGADGRDVFVHYTAIEMPGRRALEVEQRVEFEFEMTPRGPRATRVVPIAEPKVAAA